MTTTIKRIIEMIMMIAFMVTIVITAVRMQ